MADRRTPAAESRTADPPPASTGLHTLLRHDVPASLVVFLIAIPLSLGIAAASGAPLIAGLIAAVVGGLVCGLLGGTPLAVSGPAAGLVALVAGVVSEYGWAATAAIVAAAGVVQLLLGLTRLGRLAMSLSPAVVRGMLAGIGVTIMAGQLHVVLGGKAASEVLDNLSGLPGRMMTGINGASALVGAVTIALLLVWPRLPRMSVVPAPLVAVVAATALATTLRLPVERVDLPDAPLAGITLPRLPSGELAGILVAVVTIAVVASVESLLSAVAVDKMHDGQRADLDRELIAQGAANTVSGLLGGLPVTGVIVRSSTNVAAGARTRASAVLHGVWVAVFVLLLASTLELIPMAALAGVLVVMGAKLISIAQVRALWRHRELVAYLATVVGVVLLGLLEGVLVGLAVAAVGALYRLTHFAVRTEEQDNGAWRVVVHGSLVFLGVGRLARELRRIPQGRRVRLELHVDLMDHAGFEAIDDWRTSYQRLGGTVEVDEVHDTWYDRAVRGRLGPRRTLPGPLPRWFAPWSHWQRVHHEAEGQAARDGVDPMLVGMREFERRSAELVRPFLSELASRGQRPGQLFITCADSRVVPNLITSSGPGDLFCVRNIGNLVPAADAADDASVGAAIEYAVGVLGVRRIVVCGHSHCGAMAAVLAGSAPPGSHLHTWLRHAEPSVRRFHATGAAGPEDLPAEERLCLVNVSQQVDNLRSYPAVREAVDAGRLELAGLYFDISAARVFLVDTQRAALQPVPA
ncbi:SulP family inorganic anion transporter [Gandjariella thermophila]|uniref:carbonic anhydrase n=1 Tax=Gandjariella thermophila TaxID=1931992 RepID=A0A4D4J5Y8_9PSEU|nr:SulP family inorganic anion transporter [Gandjariella thermophila]GDY31971.1 carbonic anhydrase [Gandjariella thermophila]